MQDSNAGAKQQIVERIKQSTNILVTVSSNPSVDSLSAALGLTLMLNKMDKHATAVFSGAVPPAIKFLEPNKTFEHNVDSLRDFIIALDKEKADRLRYKVENDVVKIFITPYRTTITEKDLQYSQGDFNVELIIALGVEKREELDSAITAHGRILHDATVVTVNAANQKSSLGSIDWQDGQASSLSEMLVALSEALQSNILDQQISTALLTGIVAATERFSNQHTSPRVMTMAAQLMAAGANQQLIANNLRAASVEAKVATSGGPEKIPAEGSAKVKQENKDANGANGEMLIKHEDAQNAQPLPESPALPPVAPPAPVPAPELEPEIPVAPPADNGFGDLKRALEEETHKEDEESKDVASATASPDKATINAAQPEPSRDDKSKDKDSYITSKPSWMGRNVQPPTLGGTLNATSEEALESKMRQEEDQRNHALLTHGNPVDTKPAAAPAAPVPAPAPAPQPEPVAQPAPAMPPLPTPVELPPAPAPTPPPAPQPEPTPPQAPAQPSAPLMDAVPLKTEPSIEQLEQEAKAHSAQPASPVHDLDAARAAVNEALASQPFDPSGHPAEASGAQPFPVAPPAPLEPTLADAQQMNEQLANLQMPAAPAPVPNPNPMPNPTGAPAQLPTPSLPPLPPVPPLPDFNMLPPAPGVPPQPPQAPQTPPADQGTGDPAQFKIPGQS